MKSHYRRESLVTIVKTFVFDPPLTFVISIVSLIYIMMEGGKSIVLDWIQENTGKYYYSLIPCFTSFKNKILHDFSANQTLKQATKMISGGVFWG